MNNPHTAAQTMRVGTEVNFMKHTESCRYEQAYQLQFRHLERGMEDIKQRVNTLEQILARAILLLVANLAGVITLLARQVLHSS